MSATPPGGPTPAGPPPTMAEVYGKAYLLVEADGERPGRTRLVYEMESGATYSEDAAEYFAGPEGWFPPDVIACREAAGRVLDIGCGPGRHALAIAAAGHEVVGLDVSADAVAVARRRGVDARLGSLLDPPGGIGTFDTLLLLGASLALLTTYPRLRAGLAALAAVANPGARLLASDVAVDTAQEPSRLRVCIERDGRRSGWSAWSGGEPYMGPEDLAGAVGGTAWRVEDIVYPQEEARGGYLARLRLTADPAAPEGGPSHHGGTT
ncbi:class I SAM-dependent methyltransferase [Nocardiopsis sediminis]|uniref:Class I SAM-dependent methyltransferase n=1 Tax=Nocardiopsis sediminis TaxID=1778267 RepID=A0ABV8FF59_9ACTN